ncbi:membrane protein insertion efficiency factor YidD [candidate division WWE3 bacterium]|nr:membrane protein insertion efficiency factor YidD [candidate division WWE3 bacterium]
MQKLIQSLIRFYQKYISLDNLGFHICRYSPTCSEYMYQAIEKHGVAKGSLMGVYRVLRCNPFSKGGFDPVK